MLFLYTFRDIGWYGEGIIELGGHDGLGGRSGLGVREVKVSVLTDVVYPGHDVDVKNRELESHGTHH